jgi:hypothetical protein
MPLPVVPMPTLADSHGNDLDMLYPEDDTNDDDSDYDPDHDDDHNDASSTSSANSNKASTDLSAGPNPTELAGVNEPVNTTGVAHRTPGVAHKTPGVDVRTPGVADETPGVLTEPPELEEYVNELEAELDAEIAGIDSGYSPESDTNIDLDGSFTPINHEEAAALHDNAKPDDVPALHAGDASSDDKSDDKSDDENNDQLLPRLQRNCIPSYGHLKGRDGDGSLPSVARPDEFKGGPYQSHVILQSIIMMQHNLKQGIKKFGDKGKEAVLVELQQLYDSDVMAPINKYDLTPEERKGALQYLMFLKEKRCGTIKGRGCADERSQRGYMTKEETSSPTIATESLILSCVIDAIKGRDVATCDIPGAFMQSDMKGKVVMKLEGVMAEVILKDRLKYKKYVTKENG